MVDSHITESLNTLSTLLPDTRRGLNTGVLEFGLKVHDCVLRP